MAETIKAPDNQADKQKEEPAHVRDGRYLAESYITQFGFRSEEDQKEAHEGVLEILKVGHPDYRQPEPEKKTPEQIKREIDQISQGDFSSIDFSRYSAADILMMQAAREELKKHRDFLKQKGLLFGDEKEEKA